MTNESDGAISFDELRLAARNHGMPLEGLRWAVTPVGMHYTLIHYDVPLVDPGAWALEVTGRVRRPFSIGLAEIRSRPQVTMAVTFECAGNGRALLEPRPISQPWLTEAVGTGEWTGTPLRSLLEEAGLANDAVSVVFSGIDRGLEGGVEQDYERSLSVAEALSDDVLLACGLNGQPLTPQHGFPLRLVVPGWYGMTNVKWLRRIEVLDRSFEGYQQATGYRIYSDDGGNGPGTPVTRMMPRALMVPPGIPDFMTRRRIVEAGHHRLEGRAWSGWGDVTRVEVSTDDGMTWADATLGDRVSAWAWLTWSFDWDARGLGDTVLRCRATDHAGNVQPDRPSWNQKGYANNACQQIPVAIRTSRVAGS